MGIFENKYAPRGSRIKNDASRKPTVGSTLLNSPSFASSSPTTSASSHSLSTKVHNSTTIPVSSKPGSSAPGKVNGDTTQTTANTEISSKTKLGLIGLSAFVFSAMVGAGVFDLPKNMSAVAGTEAQIISWVVTGIGLLFMVLTFIILNDTQPALKAGLYKYGEQGFGPFVGFFSAWGYFVCECAGNAAYGVLIMTTLNYFFPGVFGDGSNWPAIIGATIITIVITVLVLLGVRVSNTVQMVATASIITVMTIFVVTAIAHFQGHIFMENFTGVHGDRVLHDAPRGPVFLQVMSTLVVTMWFFSGIEGAVVMSGSAKDPKMVSRATMFGYVACLILYSSVGLFSLGSFSYGQLTHMLSPSTAQILRTLWHNVGGEYIIIIVMLVAIFSSWICSLQMGAELPQRAAQFDRVFPHIFAMRSTRDVPVVSVIVGTLVMEGVLLYAHFSPTAYQLLLTITGTLTVAPYMITALYLVKLASSKEKFPTNTRHKRISSLVIGILAFIYTVMMTFSAGIQYVTISFIIYAIGLPLYIWARIENHEKKIFRNWGEWLFAVLIIGIAIAGVVLLSKGIQ